MLRNPLDWAWSDLCKRVRVAGQSPAALTDAELIARLAVPTGRSRADFGSNLARWLEHFPRERLFIGFYEDIRAEPGPFFDRLCEFIGIDPFPAGDAGPAAGAGQLVGPRHADAAGGEALCCGALPG